MGNLLTDDSFVEKASRAMGGFRYEATEDVCVMITVRYDKHGHTDFSFANEEMQGVVITVTP